MRILHVWDQAATASVIAKWQKMIGHETAVIKNKKHDDLKMTGYYGGIIVGNKYLFVLKALLLARNFEIIHLHDAWFMVVPLRILYPDKKIIMHYHGSLVRQELQGKKRRLKWERLVDQIIVSTPDLLEFDYSKKPHHVSNPVDTDLFKKHANLSNNTALISLKKNQSARRTLSELLKNGFDVKLETLTKNEKVEYRFFPSRLVQYEYYADLPVIDGKMIPTNSVCGLQAMSMGLKVINWDYSVSDSLPERHTPENVVKEIEKIYNL